MDALRAAIALLSVPGLGPRTYWNLVARFGDPVTVLDVSVRQLREAGVPEALSHRVRGVDPERSAAPILEAVERAGARALRFEDDCYPASLRFVFDPPPVLYVLGELRPSDVEAVAIVGSRHASAYGLDAAAAIATDLARAGVTVISGLARGIDSAAHRAVLDAGGRTIAVLGNGIDRVHPLRNQRLASEIVAAGAIVSELPPGVPPLAGNFPRRNRIVSGLSLGVVVVEAGARSGSLITARMAAEQGREVCAVPGPIRSTNTRGTHRLLRDGAALVETGSDVLAAAMSWRTSGGSTGRTLSSSPVLEMLERSATRRHVDELVRETGIRPERLLEELLDLELRGLVTRHSGMTYSRRVGDHARLDSRTGTGKTGGK